MSRDINDLMKEITKSNKEISKVDDRLSKEIDSLSKEIQGLKKETRIISSKIDDILELLMTLSIFIEDAENIVEDENEEYESNEGWLPEVNNWEDSYEDDDYEGDD